MHAKGKMPSGQPAGRRRYKWPTLPASAGAAATRTASAKSPEAPSTAAEASTTAPAPAAIASSASATTEQKHPEQDLAQRGKQHDQKNYAKNEQLFPGEPGVGFAAGLSRKLRTSPGQL